jgi:hypothetical protein
MRNAIHKPERGHSGAPPSGGEPGIHSALPVIMDSGLAGILREPQEPRVSAD